MSDLTADTMGWDMVFALTVSEANKAIAVMNSSPKTFSADSGEEGFHVAADFDHWELSEKGSDHSVVIKLPIPTATLTRTKDNTTVTVNSLFAEVRVELEFIATDELAKLNQAGKRNHLKVKNVRDDGEKVAHVIAVESYTGEWSDPGLPIIINAALEHWLQTNLKDFEHIFATLDLHIDPAKEQFKWMVPSDLDYAFAPGKTTDDAVLGVLTMTNGRTADAMVAQVASGAIPKDDKTAVVIGYHTVMQDLLIPGFPRVFKNTTAEEYILDSDLLGLSLSKAVALDAIDHDGKPYHPTMEAFKLRFEIDRVSINSTTSVEVSPGITSFTQVTSEYQFVIGTDESGNQTLGFHVVHKGKPTNWTRKSEGLTIAEDIALAIAFIAGVVLTVATLGAAAIVALTLVAITGGLMAATIGIIEKVGEDDAPTMTDLIDTAAAPITWPSGTDFQITGANMNDALQLVGQFDIKS